MVSGPRQRIRAAHPLHPNLEQLTLSQIHTLRYKHILLAPKAIEPLRPSYPKPLGPAPAGMQCPVQGAASVPLCEWLQGLQGRRRLASSTLWPCACGRIRVELGQWVWRLLSHRLRADGVLHNGSCSSPPVAGAGGAPSCSTRCQHCRAVHSYQPSVHTRCLSLSHCTRGVDGVLKPSLLPPSPRSPPACPCKLHGDVWIEVAALLRQQLEAVCAVCCESVGDSGGVLLGGQAPPLGGGGWAGMPSHACTRPPAPQGPRKCFEEEFRWSLSLLPAGDFSP